SLLANWASLSVDGVTRNERPASWLLGWLLGRLIGCPRDCRAARGFEFVTPPTSDMGCPLSAAGRAWLHHYPQPPAASRSRSATGPSPARSMAPRPRPSVAVASAPPPSSTITVSMWLPPAAC